jgi:hypothetical protein
MSNNAPKYRKYYAKTDDVWGVRKGKKPFIYSGKQADIILFLQPKLLYRGLKFSNQD